MAENEVETGGGGGIAVCAICSLRPVVADYRPFCSKRCADVDLHRWLSGVYAIPATEDAEEDGIPARDSEDGSGLR